MPRRDKERKKLSAVEAEISLLEKEKKMASNAMVEIESDAEIKKRATTQRMTEEKALPMDQSKITENTLSLLNRMIFEMRNLPLEYLLSQSNKMVLTTEWLLSIVEKEWINKLLRIKKMLSNQSFLVETKESIFTEIDQKRRYMLKKAAQNKIKAWEITAAITGQKKQETLLNRICKENFSSTETNNIDINIQERYSDLLSLFSLMKSSKSSVRISIPVNKKSSSSMHSSHAACIEKLRAEIGRISTIPEIAKYRQCQKQQEKRPEEQRQSVNLHRSTKHGLPVIYTESAHRSAPEDNQNNQKGAQGEK